jgi:hypothetical protein
MRIVLSFLVVCTFLSASAQHAAAVLQFYKVWETEYLTNHPDHRAGFAKVNAWWWRDLQQEPRFKTLAGTGR